MNLKVLARIEDTNSIPSMPQLVTRLIEVTRDENYNQDDVVQLLSTDPGVVADILKLANSALFGVLREINSLSQALVLLGIRRIRNLLVARSMSEWVRGGGPGTIDPKQYWRRSLLTGLLASRFAHQLCPERQEQAFMCGLLSDIGVIVLARSCAKDYAGIADEYATTRGEELVRLENAALGAAHPEVGGLVLDRWMFPQEMINVIELQHGPTPDDLPARLTLLSCAVNAAADMAWLLCQEQEPDSAADVCQETTGALGIDPADLIEALETVRGDMDDIAGVFHIEGLPETACDRIVQVLAETAAAD